MGTAPWISGVKANPRVSLTPLLVYHQAPVNLAVFTQCILLQK